MVGLVSNLPGRQDKGDPLCYCLHTLKIPLQYKSGRYVCVGVNHSAAFHRQKKIALRSVHKYYQSFTLPKQNSLPHPDLFLSCRSQISPSPRHISFFQNITLSFTLALFSSIVKLSFTLGHISLPDHKTLFHLGLFLPDHKTLLHLGLLFFQIIKLSFALVGLFLSSRT